MEKFAYVAPVALPTGFESPSAAWAVPATALPVPPAYQIQDHAELILNAVAPEQTPQTRGFTGTGVLVAMKRRGVRSGVPPRGRPV